MENESVQVDRGKAEEMWQTIEDEYCLPTVAGLNLKDEADAIIFKLRSAMIRFMCAGFVEVHEDPVKGVLITQYLKRTPEGMKEDKLVYASPSSPHMALLGVGTDNQVSNHTRYKVLASALSGTAEPLLDKLVGGDRSRMEVIGSLFLRV